MSIRKIGSVRKGGVAGKVRSAGALSPFRGVGKMIPFGRPSRGRRRFNPEELVDPNEARAVPETTFNGTILERIVYKRSLVLYGPESEATWTTQHPFLGGHIAGGGKIDFVYWLALPPLALETQGAYFHDAFMTYSDASRAFTLEGLGFRYAELFDEEILLNDDSWLDHRIQDLVGGRIPVYQGYELSLPRRLFGVLRTRSPFKQDSRRSL